MAPLAIASLLTISSAAEGDGPTANPPTATTIDPPAPFASGAAEAIEPLSPAVGDPPQSTGTVPPPSFDRPITPPASTPIPLPSPSTTEAATAERPIASPSGSFAGEALRTVVALAGVLALVLVLRQILRRVGDPLAARRPSGVVQLLARYPFGKGQSIVLLQVGRRILCVHQASGSTTTLCEIVDPDELAELRGRIDASHPDRAKFEGELARSLSNGTDRELDRPAAVGSSRSAVTAVNARRILPTETIDLTRGRNRLAGFVTGGAR